MFAQRLRDFLWEPGFVKTPVVAVTGWFTWSHLQPVLEAIVLTGTTVIVVLHVITYLVRIWCPERRSKYSCSKCPLYTSLLCSRGLGKAE